MVFLPRITTLSGSVDIQSTAWQEIAEDLAWKSSQVAADYSLFAYLPLIILTSIFSTLAFAYEIENGLLKVHLSNPNSKKNVFISKWLSCFLIVFSTLCCTLAFFLFLYMQENNLYMLFNTSWPPRVFLLAGLEALLIVSIAVSFSILSRKTSVSLVGSFATLYILQLLSDSAGMTYLPPQSFSWQAVFLFSRTGIKLSELPIFMITPIASIVLIAISYIYFSRRLELS
jgi:ABC-type transport system involved in multi-copper enzyme maturation permease subunit